MKKISIFVDGGSRGNPGKGGIGVVICDNNGKPLKEYSQYLGDNVTNNEAEYQAVIFAFKKAKALFGKAAAKEMKVEVRADSELLVKQLSGLYKVMEPRIQTIFMEVWNLKMDFKRLEKVVRSTFNCFPLGFFNPLRRKTDYSI